MGPRGYSGLAAPGAGARVAIMPTRFTEIVVDSDTELMPIARFWSTLLDWPITYQAADEVCIKDEYVEIVFGPVPEPKTVKNRVHLDLASASPAAQRDTVTRALDLGAKRIDIGQPADAPHVVLADPNGNEFCVLGEVPWITGTGVLAAITQDCADPAALGPFWSAATGRPIDRQTDTVTAMRLADGAGPWLALKRSADPKTVKNRIHLEVAPYLGDDHAAEVDRLIALGARHIDIGQGQTPWVTLADPQGNEFCVLTPRD